MLGVKQWLLIVLLVLFGAALELSAVLHLNEGHFTYSLDDAYIHLSLAQNITHGHYGINPGELSAPSSSLLWPFLLALFGAAGVPWIFVPLSINLLASVLILWVWYSILDKLFVSVWLKTALLLSSIVAFNLFGLVFTGMEHSLQVLAVLAACHGLLVLSSTGRLSITFGLVLVVGPLIRYENLAVTAAACLALMFLGRPRTSIALMFAALFPLLLFGGILHHAGLGWFPSSVLAKSEVVNSNSHLTSVFHNLVDNITEKRGRGLLFVASSLILLVGMVRKRKQVQFSLFLFAFCVAVAHLSFGRMGWYSRYEVYAWSAIVFGLVVIFKGVLEDLFRNGRFLLPKTASLVALFMFLCPSYLYATLSTPWACSNIYQQQYQMRRWIVNFWQAPLLANDVGYVSFDQPYYILDIWGLASYEALNNRDLPASEWVNRMAITHDVRGAIVYPQIALPENWHKVGTMSLANRRISVADHKVIFYADSAASAVIVRNKLFRYIEGLPDGVEFQFAN